MSVRRRQVLKGAVSLSALSLAYPLLGPRGAFAAEKTTVVVVGGGLSGLNCALLLTDFGLDVILLEGSNRIGGRAFTGDDVETRPEYGASEVGRSYARAIDLCSRLGLNLIPDIRSLLPMSNYVDGTWVTSAEWPDSPVNKTIKDERAVPPLMLANQLLSRLNPLKELDDWLSPDFASFDISMQELFEKNGVSHAALKLMSRSADLGNTSGLGMMQEQTRTKFDANFGRSTPQEAVALFGLAAGEQEENEVTPIRNIEGGTSRLPEAMAQALGDRVRPGKFVAEIDMSGSGAEVRCVDGSRYRAEFVISAAPFSTLRNITVSPRYTGRQAEAVATLGYRGTTRAFGVLSEPYWADGHEPSFFTDETIQALLVLDKLPNEDKHRFTVIFTGPASARIDQLPDDQAIALIESEIARIRPSTKGKLQFLSLYGWRKNPMIQGCRHLFAPGQINRFAREMIIPHHRLHFAGEHTRRMDFGMEAALESGERAAFEILQRA